MNADELGVKALALNSPADFWPLLTKELARGFSCGRAVIHQADALPKGAEFGCTLSASNAALTLGLTAQRRLCGVIELMDKTGGFSQADADALEKMAPPLAALVSLFALAERQDQLSMQLLQMEKLAGIGRLVAGFSHEVRTPLTVIYGYTQKLMDEITEPGQHKDLGRIMNAVKGAEALVKNLLGFSRVSKATIASVDLGELINSTLDMVSLEEKWRDAKIAREYDPKTPRIDGNANTLMQVFFNLTVNALQAMEGQAAIRLTFRVRPDAARKEVIVEVTDNGPGMPPEIREKIFEPFFTTKGKQGTGLGLYLVTEIMENHRGKIAAASTPGQGTTFTLSFPVN